MCKSLWPSDLSGTEGKELTCLMPDILICTKKRKTVFFILLRLQGSFSAHAYFLNEVEEETRTSEVGKLFEEHVVLDEAGFGMLRGWPWTHPYNSILESCLLASLYKLATFDSVFLSWNYLKKQFVSLLFASPFALTQRGEKTTICFI